MKISNPEGRGTLTSSVYELIRQDIVTGRLPPGEKLRIEGLRERYSLGGSPIREALNRLSSEGLVHQHDQRGFGVVPVSAQDLLELTRTRMLLNEITIRESLQLGDQLWEENLVLAHHRLSRTTRKLCRDRDDPNPEWEKRHREFHAALIASCESRWLCSFHETLFDFADRYRHLVAVVDKNGRDSDGEHRAILDAAISRDVAKTIAIVNDHIRATSEQVKQLGLVTLEEAN